MSKCKIAVEDGLHQIIHPNGNAIPRVISTKVYQELHFPPVVEVELFSDERLEGAVKYLDERLRTHATESLFTMPTGEPIPYIDESTIRKVSEDIGRYRFLIQCEFGASSIVSYINDNFTHFTREELVVMVSKRFNIIEEEASHEITIHTT